MTLLLLVAVLLMLVVLHTRTSRAEQLIERLRGELLDTQAALGTLRDEVARQRSRPPAAPSPPADAPRAQPPAVPAASIPAPIIAAPSHVSAPPSSPPFPPHDLPAVAPAVAETDETDVERAIGERWLLYAGVVVLLLAVTYFLRYAFDRNWLSPVVRVLLGGGAGIALAVAGRRLAAAGFRTYGLIVAGAGIGALYLSIYAALNFYELLSPGVAFALLVAVSAAAAWMADREIAPALALVSACGGFATPFLVGGGQDAQVTLFTYVALLIAGITWLAMRRDWWYLDLLSLAFTIVTVASWFVTFYTPARAIRTELFLTLYCAMFLVILRGSLRWGSATARDGARLLLIAPLLYHLSSIAILTPHHEAFLTYMILATTAMLVVADRVGSSWLRAIAWVAVALPLAGWLEARSAPWISASLITVAAVYAAHLAAQVNAIHADESIRPPDLFVVHANGLGVYGAVVIVLESQAPQWLAAIAAALAVWHGALAAAARRRRLDIAPHWAAVAATLTAIAAARQFDGPWVVVMWAVEAAAVIAIATRSGRRWFRAAGWILMLIAIGRWMAPDVQQTSITAPILLNPRTLSALLIVALVYATAWWQARQAGGRVAYRGAEVAIAMIAASALTVVLISREIVAYWEVRGLSGEAVDIAREAMLSTAWAIYAAAAIAIGMRRRYAPIRYFAIALFGLTLLKVFILDMGMLGGIYRIAAFFVVGAVLLFASFLYQRRRAAVAKSEP